MVANQNMGKGTRAVLNTDDMDIEVLPDSLKDYARKLEEENTIDITQMFMALGSALAGVHDEILAWEKRPWWRKLCGLPPKP